MNIQYSSKKNDEKSSERNFSLESENDLIEIRKYGRNLAKEIGFKTIDQTIIAAAISEICRNVLEYAGYGDVIMIIEENDSTCLRIIVKDEGPGIENLEEALKEEFSSSGGLGIGLSGTERLMDEFNIQSSPGKGTTVEMCKCLKHK